LKASASEKSAVKALEEHVQPDTKTAGERVDESTEKAETEFKDWALGSGITDDLKGWHASAKALHTRLSVGKIALNRIMCCFVTTTPCRVGTHHTRPPTQCPENTPCPSRVSNLLTDRFRMRFEGGGGI
jgi:hypothetical protein